MIITFIQSYLNLKITQVSKRTMTTINYKIIIAIRKQKLEKLNKC